MAKLTAAEKVEGGKELTPARLLAFELWKENPQITTAELGKALKEKGFEVGKTTRATWLTRFRKGSRIRTYEGKPLTAVKPRKRRIAVKPSEITLEQIIKAVGSVEALSLLQEHFPDLMDEYRWIFLNERASREYSDRLIATVNCLARKQGLDGRMRLCF